jgi:hypothetical protein
MGADNMQEQHATNALRQCICLEPASSKPTGQHTRAMQVLWQVSVLLQWCLTPFSPLPCHLAESKYGNINGPATILVPTDKAWMDFLTAQGVNTTTLEALSNTSNSASQAASWAVGLGIRSLVSYHIINATVTAGTLTNGRTLPTYLPDAGDITVRHGPPSPSNISFVGAVNETDPTAVNNNTNVAAILMSDIPVEGYPDCFMDVVDRVLTPPVAVFNQTLQALAKADIEKAVEQAAALADAPGPTQ